MTAPLTLLVLYVSDLEASRRFYAACGLDFVAERHGNGPRHYAATLPGHMVVELYPCGGKPVTRTRIGLRVADIEATLRRLAEAGVTDISEPRDLPYGRVRVVRDPDGNAVELVEAAGDAQR